MDPVAEIKARLPIEQLVSQYCQLKPKGKSFVALCPFHSDKHPSLLVSPDKGIAYCFACNSGGDIFSFYQKIENVDFPQALRELAEKTAVALPQRGAGPIVDKDEKQRLRECVEAAHAFFRKCLKATPAAQEYLQARAIPGELVEDFGLGYAPDSFRDTYQHLLKEGFSRKEIIAAGLAIQKDLRDEHIYDRFRNRIIFPIEDLQGRVVAFGGRTIGDGSTELTASDAKYINSSEGPIYRKSATLFGLSRAREAIREMRKVVMVEGYFDLLACHKVGIRNVVAVSGTSLTEEHARILKRLADTVVLCLDADRAGQEASERAFILCSREGLLVFSAMVSGKDPDEAARLDPDALRHLLAEEAVPYLDRVHVALQSMDLQRPEERRVALHRILPLLAVLPTAVEREQYLRMFAAVFGSSEVALQEDLQRLAQPSSAMPAGVAPSASERVSPFSPIEVTLTLFVLYPRLRHLLSELIAPQEGFPAALHAALQAAGDAGDLPMVDDHRERLGVLLLFCEQHGFHEWAESLALSEIRRNCDRANRFTIIGKQREITTKLIEARREGKVAEEAQLQTQYQQVLKLSRMAR
jgi:DNA primase